MSKLKQLSFLPKQKRSREHGGSLAVRRRRSLRPLNLKQTHHITMKSHHAIGPKSLFRHKKMILSLFKKFSTRFGVKVIEYAIQGNHMHLLVKAQNREGLQNFFRVIAGHSAQKILQKSPIPKTTDQRAGGAPAQEVGKGKLLSNSKKGCRKNQRRFWSYLLYSRIVSWGQDFKAVVIYIQRNTLELLQIIAYQPRISNSVRDSGRCPNSSGNVV